MTRAVLFLFSAAVFIALAGATPVNECGSGKKMEDTQKVLVSGCDAQPCKLKRKTRVVIEEKFTPDADVQKLTTSVHATILGVPLPFIGVDGTDACNKIFTTDGTATPCPLKKGVEYVYKNEFPILSVYPTVELTVYWALKEDNNIISCFEVPAKIVK